MAYLNWTKEELGLESLDQPRVGMALKLTLTPEQWKVLSAEASPVFHSPGSELRVDLPQNWTLFWKAREGESRLLLAHPEADSWVATLALTDAHAQAFFNAAPSEDGGTVALSRLGTVSRLGNFDLILAVGK